MTTNPPNKTPRPARSWKILSGIKRKISFSRVLWPILVISALLNWNPEPLASCNSLMIPTITAGQLLRPTLVFRSRTPSASYLQISLGCDHQSTFNFSANLTVGIHKLMVRSYPTTPQPLISGFTRCSALKLLLFLMSFEEIFSSVCLGTSFLLARNIKMLKPFDPRYLPILARHLEDSLNYGKGWCSSWSM